jgi:hypothetical protein
MGGTWRESLRTFFMRRHDDPQVLTSNGGRSFTGCFVFGNGFIFDDSDSSGESSTISEMNRLLEKDKRNSLIVFPLLGGEEFLNSPDTDPPPLCDQLRRSIGGSGS